MKNNLKTVRVMPLSHIRDRATIHSPIDQKTQKNAKNLDRPPFLTEPPWNWYESSPFPINVRSICDQTEHTDQIGSRSVSIRIGSCKMAELSPIHTIIADRVYEHPESLARSLAIRSWTVADQHELFTFCPINRTHLRSDRGPIVQSGYIYK